MAYSYTWDETKPAGGRALNLGDDDIREFKSAIRERLADGGMYFPATDDADAGSYNFCKFIEQAANPTAEANRGHLFCKDVSGVTELYWMDSSGNVIQVTTGGKILITSLAIASEARGDILTRGASAWQRTAVGASGTFIRSDGTDPGYNTIQEGDISYANLMDGAFIQQQVGTYATYASGSTAFPDDDTIPQNTEGDQFISVTITPKDTTHRLKIVVIIHCSTDGDNQVGVALFQDTTAAALAAVSAESPVPQHSTPIVLIHEMAAGTTSATTFKVRAGKGNGGNVFVNGTSAARLYGGKMVSSITVTEVKA